MGLLNSSPTLHARPRRALSSQLGPASAGFSLPHQELKCESPIYGLRSKTDARLEREGPDDVIPRRLFAICGLAPICCRIHVPVIPPCPDELGAAQVALLLSCFTQSRLKAFFSPVPARFLRLGTLFDRRAILFDLGTVASWERLAVLR
jgi:hypothetical protein